MSNLNQAQQSALDAVEKIMKEHFDSAVFMISTSHETEDKKDVVELTYHGGYAACVGLCELAKLKIVRSELQTNEDEII